VTGPDIVGDDAPRRWAAAGRRRRWVTILGGVVVAALAAVTAARSGPEPRPAVPEPQLPPVAVVDLGPPVVSLAVGPRAAYALVGLCDGPEQARTCSYRILRRSVGGGGWVSRPLVAPELVVAGFSARVFVTGEDTVTVVDAPVGGRAYVSQDGGVRFTARTVRPGPPVAAVPAAGILDLGLCPTCADRLTVLDPATGLLQPLATQPPLRQGAPVRALAVQDGVLWAVGGAGPAASTAVSTDRGRTWRARPVPGLRLPAEVVRVAATPAGEAYLLVGRDSRPDVLNEFSELWRVDGPDGTWRPATPEPRPPSALSVLAGERGLLVSDESGTVWRRQPDGTMSRLPDAVVDGQPRGPGALISGRGRLLLGHPVDGPAPGLLLVSTDEGETWTAERLPN
jgi:hypothetical protein